MVKNEIEKEIDSGRFNIIFGGDGNTFYVQGSDNTIVVVNSSDVIYAQPDTSNNTVVAGVDFVLQANVQNLALSGTDDLTGKGNSADNVITANGGNDMLIGGAGNDKLIGGSGNDTFNGGAGDDTLIGGSGQNTFLMSYGMGQDTVMAVAAGNRILLDPSISFNNLTAEQSGNDLLLPLRGTNAGLAIKDYYLGTRDWTVTDSSGAHQSTTDILAAIASQDEFSALRADYISALKAGLSANSEYSSGDLVGSTVTMREDTTTETFVQTSRLYASFADSTFSTTQSRTVDTYPMLSYASSHVGYDTVGLSAANDMEGRMAA